MGGNSEGTNVAHAGATLDEMHAGWWVKLEGEESELRELAAHFNDPALEVIQEDNSFWLGSADFVDLTDPEAVRGAAASSLRSLPAPFTSSSAGSTLHASPPPSSSTTVVRSRTSST
jgi:hypothetical protein